VGKAGGVDLPELEALASCATTYGADVLLAYNRRFYASVIRAREILHEDGGLRSLSFEFTEWAHTIDPATYAHEVLRRWVLANSSHVLDLAFHLGGLPREWHAWSRGRLNWHPDSARFVGAGVTQADVTFSYSADWQGPGRWGVELVTAYRRLILRPMERLQVVRLGSVAIEPIDCDDALDHEFKPGLYRQVDAFLRGDYTWFCRIDQQLINARVYARIAGYT